MAMIIHFIGIGGIGVSGIARIYQSQGHIVRGSDQEASELTQEMIEQGISVFIGHNAENIKPEIDLVVFSEAVGPDNAEILRAQKLKIRCWSGAQALADLSSRYYTIAVSGMHGKSTTASMIAQIMIQAGLDPTFVIGTKPGWRLGQSRYLLIEADDYKAKFLHYHPDVLVLTNIEKEHLDYFKNLERILNVFSRYVNQVKSGIVAWGGDNNIKNVLKTLKNKSIQAVKYSLADVEALKLKANLKVPGQHNILNALAALKTARLLGISDQVTFRALGAYRGVWRRFEETDYYLLKKRIRVIQDYGHHPTEIAATMEALAEKYRHRSVWVVFQPHQYQRTFYLFEEFVKVFQKTAKQYPDWHLIITDIYDVAGREDNQIKLKVNSAKLVQEIKRRNVVYRPMAENIDYLQKQLKNRDVLLLMGAGDIYKMPAELFTIASSLKIWYSGDKSRPLTEFFARKRIIMDTNILAIILGAAGVVLLIIALAMRSKKGSGAKPVQPSSPAPQS